MSIGELGGPQRGWLRPWVSLGERDYLIGVLSVKVGDLQWAGMELRSCSSLCKEEQWGS